MAGINRVVVFFDNDAKAEIDSDGDVKFENNGAFFTQTMLDEVDELIDIVTAFNAEASK